MSRYAECYRLNVDTISLGRIVENHFVRVVVIAAMRRLDVNFVATFVVALAAMRTQRLLIGVMGMA